MKTHIEMITDATIMRIEDRAAEAIVGPSKAFFEVLGYRCIYESIVYVAPTPEEALEALEHIIVREMIRRDGDGTQEGNVWLPEEGYSYQMLVWRMPHKIEVSRHEFTNQWKARTRVGYLPVRAKP